VETFWDILANYRRSLSWALGGSSIVPLLSVLSGFAPPGSPEIVVVTSMFTLIVIVVAFQLLKKAPEGRVALVSFGGAVVFVLLTIYYLSLTSRFTFSIPNDPEGAKIYLGCGWSELALEAAEKYQLDKQGCPGNFFEISKGANYDVDPLYAPGTVAQNEFFIKVVWLLTFLSYAVALGSFVVRYTPGRKPRGRAVVKVKP
jgi:hypothetical protein